VLLWINNKEEVLSNLVKFKNLGIELEGELIEKSDNVFYIKTPFRGNVYAVEPEDIVDDTIATETTIITQLTDVEVVDEFNDLIGRTVIGWDFCVEVHDDSLMTYVKIYKQIVPVLWDCEDPFESNILINEIWEDGGVNVNSLNTKDIKPKTVYITLGGVSSVEF